MTARIAVALGVALAVVATTGSPASPLTRAQADARALEILKPTTKKSHTGVVVYGRRAALAKGTDVFELPAPARTSRSPKHQRLRYKAFAGLAGRPWIFWMDTKYGARFSPRTTLLLLA